MKGYKLPVKDKIDFKHEVLNTLGITIENMSRDFTPTEAKAYEQGVIKDFLEKYPEYKEVFEEKLYKANQLSEQLWAMTREKEKLKREVWLMMERHNSGACKSISENLKAEEIQRNEDEDLLKYGNAPSGLKVTDKDGNDITREYLEQMEKDKFY